MQKNLPKIFFIVFFVLFGVLLSKNIAPHYIRNISSASEMYMYVEGEDIKGEKRSKNQANKKGLGQRRPEAG